MKKSIYLSFFMLALSTVIYAQQDTSKPSYMYSISAQFQSLDFNDFNQQLEALNLLGLPGHNIELGMGFTQFHRRFLSEISIVLGHAESSLDDIRGQNSEFRYIGLRVSEAINVLNPKSDWFVGPEIAWNGSFQQILVTGRNNGNNFQEAALNAVYSFERLVVTMDLGLNVSKTIRYKDIFKQPRTMNIGFRGGYRIDDRESVWKLKQAIALNDLGIYTGGWYGAFSLRVGLY